MSTEIRREDLPFVSPMQEESVVFTDSSILDRSAARYLFFPLNVLNPRRQQELEHLRTHGGGEELASACAWRHKRFLPRCYFLPLEMGATWIPADLVPDGQLNNMFKGVETEGAIWATTLPGEKEYPGDALTNIISGAYNDGGMRKGIVEATPLRGITWAEFEESGWQKLFFPHIPKTLREIQSLTASVKGKTSDPDVHLTADQLVTSCDEARLWGSDRVDIENTLVALGRQGEWVHKYSYLAEVLMPQLELKPQNRPIEEMAAMQAKLTESLSAALGAMGQNSGNESVVLLASAVEKINANQDVITQLLAKVLGEKEPAKRGRRVKEDEE